MDKNIKSGKEILDDFFKEILDNESIDKKLAATLADLYDQGKFTDSAVKNALYTLRNQNAS